MNENEERKAYWDGTTNFGCRVWFYLMRGFEIVERMKYLFLVLFGFYLKGKRLVWLLSFTVIALPVILAVGYFNAHKLSKVLDYLGTKFSTHYSLLHIELLREIRDLLKEK